MNSKKIVLAFAGFILGSEAKTCPCSDTDIPVCSNAVTFRNACVAKCNNVLSWKSGACSLDAIIVSDQISTGTRNFNTGSLITDFVATTCNCQNAVLDPVCGENSITYNSECQANCQGVQVLYHGLCNNVSSSFVPRPSTPLVVPMSSSNSNSNFSANFPINANNNSKPATNATNGIALSNSGFLDSPNSFITISLTGARETFPAAGGFVDEAILEPINQQTTNINDILPIIANNNTTPQVGRSICGCQGLPFDPVCGVNYVTYNNECQANCQGKEIQYKGICRGI